MNNQSFGRIESIDVLRGLALALMLMVNNPGSWSAVYAPFLHADWHGLTPTDLVFPFFLFVVGASMACSLRVKLLSQNGKGLPWFSILKRGFLLFAIGLLLNIIPFDKAMGDWRILGVLQRISLCFLLVALVIAFVKERLLIAFSACVLLAYWLITIGFSDNPHSLESNAVRQLDIAVLGASHLWQGKGIAFDPEGLLSTISSSITVLSGYIVVYTTFTIKEQSKQVRYLLMLGAGMLILGLLWSIVYPVNKSLWTSTFVLVCSGLACLCLAVIIFFEQRGIANLLTHGLKVYGSNPIFIYVVAWFTALLLGRTSFGESSFTVKAWAYNSLAEFMPDKLASLIYAILFMLLFYGLALALYKRRIFIRL